MALTLYHCDTIETGLNRILFFGSPDSALAFDWAPLQRDYLKKCFKESIWTVQVNHFDRMDLVVIPEAGKAGPDLMESLRHAGAEITALAGRLKWEEAVLVNRDQDSGLAECLLEGILLGSYQFLKYFSKPVGKELTFKKLGVYEGDRVAIETLQSIAEAVFFARNLVNEPVSWLNAPRLAEELKRVGTAVGLAVEVFDKARIEALKMGGLLAVNKGSIDPPRFVILTWEPESPVNESPLVLVGKGVMFDTGGLSLKPTPNSMDEMKTDMAGAAAVAGVMIALARLNLPVRTIALIPATDNRPDGNAYVPGDVIQLQDGTTVEVLNCDAEGRLILADALLYAARYQPGLVVDVATLTGSAQVALGPLASAVMGTAPDEIFKKLEVAAFNTWERIVRFPLWSEYGKMLESEIADLKNIGGRYAGAITAGKFLERFTSYPWIHLDIAGTAFNTTRDSYRGIGATGTGVRLMIDFIRKNYLDN
ncbi:MAG: leucyl aminopeptidase [Bacteroidales bacterium]